MIRHTGVIAAFLMAWLGIATAQPAPATMGQLEALSEAFRAVHSEAAPTVVLVETSSDWRRRLPRFHPRIPRRDDEGEQQPLGLGSGVIIRPDGYILSNHHVIRDADSIDVVLQDRRRLRAHVVGVDSLIDIALLKVEATGLPVARLGTSADLQIGDWVLAIGYPLGMGTTLTHGIVSALGRQANLIGDVMGIESFIQTNAVINPGNSGGPLLDLEGRVVGINTAISTMTGFYMGYGLAVPIDLAAEAVDDLLTHGRIVRGYLGISMRSVDDALVRRLNLDLDPPRGVLVDEVQSNTAAQAGGLLDNDVLLTVDGEPVNLPNEVQTRIYSRDPGEAIELELMRDGRIIHMLVTLGEREQDQRLARGERRLDLFGMTVASVGDRAEALGLTAAIVDELGLADGTRAVVIVDIDPEGPAASKGLEVDDIITEIDQTRVESVDVLVQTVADMQRGESALLWLWRQDRGIDVRALRIGERR